MSWQRENAYRRSFFGKIDTVKYVAALFHASKNDTTTFSIPTRALKLGDFKKTVAFRLRSTRRQAWFDKYASTTVFIQILEHGYFTRVLI